jgi:hypothetical protein
MNFSEGNSKLLLTSVVGVLGLGSLAYYLASESNVSFCRSTFLSNHTHHSMFYVYRAMMVVFCQRSP